jgi:hypothetical protein
VLVRVAVDRVLEEVGANAAVVQQGVRLARGAVAGDRPSVPLGCDQEVEHRPLGLLDPISEGAVGLERAQPGLLLAPPERLHGGGGSLASLRVLQVEPERAAVGRDLVEVDDRQSLGGEDAFGRREREVREVLVVDRVEEVRLDELHQVRELDRRRSLLREEGLHARDEVVQVRRLGEHVVGDDQVRRLRFLHELARRLLPEEGDAGRHSALEGCSGDVPGGLDPERRDLPLDEVLEQVAVVARQLDDEALLVQPEPVYDVRHVLRRVLDERVRVRGEVRVLREDRLRSHVLGQLDEQAIVADAHVQRVERLHPVELVGGQEALA